jgi:hypothetical protein
MNDQIKEPYLNCLVGNHHVVQIGDEWHVLFQPDRYPRQYISIARFQDFERASSYASLENDMQEDDGGWSQHEDIHKIANLSVAPLKVIQVIPPVKCLPEIDGPLSDLENEIIADMPILMKDFPYGASIKELVKYYGLENQDNRVRNAMKTINARKMAAIVTWPDEPGNTIRLVALNHMRPAMRLTDPEKAILEAIKKLSSADGICGVSARTLGITAGFGKAGNALDLVWSLQRKKVLEIIPSENEDIGTSCRCRLLEAA